ncbi:FtsX-like permease family protein [Streptomyces sp. NPDC057729]|uniref:FtsX-like permease family protein n=1 Tax=Streptomyces sp. NPDC057729 TaxID=3346230 RepID=UPI0036CA25E7
MSVLIVVASAVGTGTRRIGILKAVGFTPAQVLRAYVGQALVPAAVGTALGVLAGRLLAVPVLAETEEVYGTSSLTITPWGDLVVIAGALGLVARPRGRVPGGPGDCVRSMRSPSGVPLRRGAAGGRTAWPDGCRCRNRSPWARRGPSRGPPAR